MSNMINNRISITRQLGDSARSGRVAVNNRTVGSCLFARSFEPERGFKHDPFSEDSVLKYLPKGSDIYENLITNSGRKL